MTSSASSPQDLEKGVNTLENIETLPQQGSIAGVSQGFPNIQEIYSDRDFITLGSSTYRRRDLLNALDRGDGEEGNCAKYTPHQFAIVVQVLPCAKLEQRLLRLFRMVLALLRTSGGSSGFFRRLLSGTQWAMERENRRICQLR